jgi:hypothetical protein
MNTAISNPISKEEIDWVKAKHSGIQSASRKILKEAIEIGEWFVEADDRLGLKKGPHGGRGGEWRLWLSAKFPEIGASTVAVYMRLANGREFLEEKLGISKELSSARQFSPTIKQALRMLHDRDQQSKEQHEPDLPPAEFEEPLAILRDQLKSYVYQQFQLEYLGEQIRFRIKNAKLGRRQVRQAVESVTVDHPELRDMILRAFLP